MATPLQIIYGAFLAKVEADDWMLNNLTEVDGELSYSSDLKEDLEAILNAAIVQFRYPRVSLDYEGEYFKEDLGNDEIQVLANLMKLEWIRRCIATWDNIRQLYSDKDFSQANFLDKLNKTGE
jgi:hypothetical protein